MDEKSPDASTIKTLMETLEAIQRKQEIEKQKRYISIRRWQAKNKPLLSQYALKYYYKNKDKVQKRYYAKKAEQKAAEEQRDLSFAAEGK